VINRHGGGGQKKIADIFTDQHPLFAPCRSCRANGRRTACTGCRRHSQITRHDRACPKPRLPHRRRAAPAAGGHRPRQLADTRALVDDVLPQLPPGRVWEPAPAQSPPPCVLRGALVACRLALQLRHPIKAGRTRCGARSSGSTGRILSTR
jgi:hypothetical protein